MKLKCFIVSLLIIILISVNASALTLDDHSLEFNVGEEYTVLTPDNLKKNEDFIKTLGYSLTALKANFEQNGVIMFAADSANTRQIKLTYNQTDFSKQIGSLSSLKDDDIYSVSEKILGTGVEWTLAVANNMKMYCVASKGSDSGGEYCTVQYFTIINGGIYNLSYSETSADIYSVADSAEKIVSNLKITDKDSIVNINDVDSIILIILIGIIILAAVAVIVYITVTFIIDLKNKRASDDSDKVIRRRRF